MMKNTALTAYTLLVLGWAICMLYHNGVEGNMLTPYFSAIRAEKCRQAIPGNYLVKLRAGGMIKTFCCDLRMNAAETSTALVYKSHNRQAFIHLWQHCANNTVVCFNNY